MRISKSLKTKRKRKQMFKAIFIALIFPLSITSCYTYKWTNTKTVETAEVPKEIKQLFNDHNNKLRLSSKKHIIYSYFFKLYPSLIRS